MADLVKFFVGNQENLDDLQKIKGQLVIALDTSNPASPKGILYYDYNATQRIKLRDEIAEKAMGDETGLNIRQNYLTSIEGNRNNDSYTITTKTGSGVTKNTFNVPINLVGSSATSSKIFLLGAAEQSNDGNNSYTNNNFYIESNVLNGAFKGNLTGKATTAGTADVALSVGWDNVSGKPNLVSSFTTSESTTAFNITPKSYNGANLTAISIPAANSTRAGLITSAEQTLGGNKNLLGNLTVGSNTDATARTLYVRRKNSSSSNYGTFSITLPAAANYADIGFQYNESGTSSGYNLYMNNSALYPKSNNVYDLGTSSYKFRNIYATTFNGNATSATKATNDGTGANINTTYVKSVTGAVGSGYVVTVTKGNGSASTFTIPLASASSVGLMSTGTQTFAGNKTFNNSVTFLASPDVALGSYSSPAITVGPSSGSHLEIDVNEIMAKANASTSSELCLNNEGGLVAIGPGGIQTKGHITSGATSNTLDIGTSSNYFRNIYASSFSGNAATATRLQTARTIRTNLSSTSTASFDGTANITPGISGTLPVAYGGTGATGATAARANLGITPGNIGAYPITGGDLWGNIRINTSITNRDNPTSMNLVFNSGQPASGITVNNVNAPGIGFHIANTGWCSIKFVPTEIRFLDDSNNSYIPIRASTYYGSGSNLTNLNASNITSGTLAVARGGTGLTSSPSLLVNLGATSAASIFAASPRPGITGILAVSHGGTGASSASTARTNLGAAAAEHTHSFTDDITGTVPVSRGGTGAWEAGAACTNLGAVTISTSQSITGAKTFKSTTTIQNNGTAPTLSFQSNNTTLTARTATIFNNLVSTTGINNYLYFRLYSRKTGGTVTSYYEDYRLPTSTSNRTNNGTYEILTSKAKVTVAQGGTGTGIRGAQSGGALANLGCIYSTSEPMSVYEGMIWLKPVT